MRTFQFRISILIAAFHWGVIAHAQTNFTTNNFTLLNPQTVQTQSSVYTANQSNLVTAQPVSIAAYKTNWVINYGIPVQASMDYAYLRARMTIAYQMRPHIYNNGTAALRTAVDILELAPFTKISAWMPVRTELNYRYMPAVLWPASSVNNSYNPQSQPIKGSNFFQIR